MSLVQQVGPVDQVAAPKRYRSNNELEMRDAVDQWGRAMWPGARVVHELVMNRGTVRADMAFVGPNHLVSIELKSESDGTDRLLNQVAMFRLATPETWIVADQKHMRDVGLVRYLLPSIGIAVAKRDRFDEPIRIEVMHDHGDRYAPHPEALLSLLWVSELVVEARLARVWQGKTAPHAVLVRHMLRLGPDEQIAAVCRQLRGRNALWRADPVQA